MDLLEIFKWRYATKKFNPIKKIDQQLVDQIVEAAWLAPSSSGLQPFQIFEITNQDLKKEIMPIAYNQEQIADCSHLLVFAAWDNYTRQRIDDTYKYIAKGRDQDPELYKDYADQLKKVYLKRTDDDNFKHAAHQAYISIGFAMAMAAYLRVDSTPMEGFNSSALDDLLDLRDNDLRSVVLLALGYRDEVNDWLVSLKKMRHPMDEFLIKIE